MPLQYSFRMNNRFRSILIGLLAALTMCAAWFNPVTTHAREEIQEGFERALTVFAAARALGAVVSIAQGTQVAMQPAGVGVNLTPGEALQPLDQLIDHFANVMLVASVSFGMQLLLLEIGSHWIVSAALTAAVLSFMFLRWRGGGVRWLQPALIALLVLRFAVPVSAFASEVIYRTFMSESYVKELALIKVSSTKVIGGSETEPSPDENHLSRLQRWKKSLTELKAPDLKAKYEAILVAASEWSRSIVKLIALFVVQTIVLPVVLLWLVVRMGQTAIRTPQPSGKALAP